jgi:tryptophan synthase beta chain
MLNDMLNRTTLPDERGYYGRYGGRFVPETVIPALDDLTEAYGEFKNDAGFQAELMHLHHTYTGRPTPVSYAKRLSEHLGGAQIYLKREDLAHSGAHKINNALGQALMAQRMGNGVASATVSALLGLECHVYMGTVDMARQQPNVFRMKLLGAEVIPVDSGTKTLKDAINEAMRDWVTNVRDTFYLLGSALGPHPYPLMVRDFQSIIGIEAREQVQKLAGRLPDAVIACVGGGSNAIGIFHAFRNDANVRLIGVEAGGYGVESGQHAARFADPAKGRLGILQGTKSYVLQDDDGQIAGTHSISAGLDYASVGPEHAYLREIGRAEYTYATDSDAMHGLQMLCKYEGIIPALESAHGVAEAIRIAPTMPKDSILLVNVSGRGDKDLGTIMSELDNK